MDDLHLMQEFESGIGNNKTVFCRHPEIIHSGLSRYFQPLKMGHLPDPLTPVNINKFFAVRCFHLVKRKSRQRGAL